MVSFPLLLTSTYAQALSSDRPLAARSVRQGSRRPCEVGERGTQPGPVSCANAPAAFDAAHRRIAHMRDLMAGLGEVDSFGAPVFRVGDAHEIAVALEAVDDEHEGLFGGVQPGRQLG